MKIMKLRIEQCHESHPDYAGMWFVEAYLFVWSAARGAELDELSDFAGPFAHRGTAYKAAQDCMTVSPQVSMLTDDEYEATLLVHPA